MIPSSFVRNYSMPSLSLLCCKLRTIFAKPTCQKHECPNLYGREFPSAEISTIMPASSTIWAVTIDHDSCQGFFERLCCVWFHIEINEIQIGRVSHLVSWKYGLQFRFSSGGLSVQNTFKPRVQIVNPPTVLFYTQSTSSSQSNLHRLLLLSTISPANSLTFFLNVSTCTTNLDECWTW